MAVLSNVEKYMIDGVEIPVYPSSVTVSDNLVSKSWNNMYGEFQDIPVNLKIKVNWIFDYINNNDYETLYGQMIRAAILEKKSRYFELNTFFPGVGFVKGTFYLGTPTTFNSKDWMTSNGKPTWWQGELHWIEVKGTRLNDPTTPIVPDSGGDAS